MPKENPEFLSKKYADLPGSKPVERAVQKKLRQGEKGPATKEARVDVYLERLENIIKNPAGFQRERGERGGLELLKHKILAKYVTKLEEIPESYWKSFEKMLRERGEAGDWANASPEQRKTEKHQRTESILNDQRASLEQWIDYLASSDDDYPRELKYWVFRNILNLQEYDKEKKEFPKRSKGTLKQFPDLNHEALGYIIDAMAKKMEGRQIEFEHDIRPEERAAFQQTLQKEDFAKLYAWANELMNPIPEHLLPVTEGKWVTYSQGSDARALVKTIRGKGTGWCTAGENTARNHLRGGDFHVYYTRDDNGEVTIPRLAIRMDGHRIAENPRGIAYKQNLDPYMIRILDEKLKSFGSEGRAFQKKSADMQRLTEIEQKAKVNNQQLAKDELLFLYEIDNKIEGFGYKRDPRIQEILSSRDIKSDLSLITGYSKEQISVTKEEALRGGIKYHYGDLDLSNLTSAEGLKLPESIGGNLSLFNLTSAEGLKLPESIGGYLYLSNLTSAKGLKLPESIGGGLDLFNLTSAEGLKLPESIGGSLSLFNLTSADIEKIRKKYPRLRILRR